MPTDMKKFIYRIFILTGLASMNACNFLSVDRIGTSDMESFFSDVNSLEYAVNGVYHLAYTFYDEEFLIYSDVAGDIVTPNQTETELQTIYNFESLETEEASYVGHIWKAGYEVISNANEVIMHIDKIRAKFPDQEVRINNAMAQAYFMRALMTFNISLCYSQHYTYTSDASHDGVIIITKRQGLFDQIPRSSMSLTYQQIISDINTAKAAFTDANISKPKYASSIACDALLARVYLYMGDYDNARQYANSVITNSGLTLTPNGQYQELFSSTKREPGEVILKLDGYNRGSALVSTYGFKDFRAKPSSKLLGIFDEDRQDGREDVREKLLNYRSDTLNVDNVCTKYTILDGSTDKERYASPFVLRLSEMYLIRAEANCKMQDGNLEQAASDIALLQARAYGVDASEISLTYADASELFDIVMRERIKELCFEGGRLFDITRNRQNLERGAETGALVTSLSYPNDEFILPIPFKELEANGMLHSNPINTTKQ